MPPIFVIALVAGSIAISGSLAALFFRKPKWTDDSVRATVERSVEEALERASLKEKTTERRELGEALGSLYEKQLEGFGKSASVLNDILQAAGELAVHRYAVALGSRGGKKRAANLEARKAPARRADVFDHGCEACVDPLTKNSQAIAKHVLENHAGRKRQADEAASAQPSLPLNGQTPPPEKGN
jgi:hypothetical protein